MPVRVCAEHAHAHAREGVILALASLALGAPPSLRSPSTTAHPGHRSLATLARSSLRSPSKSTCHPLHLRLPRSLRSLGLPASYARGKPPYFVVRAWERAAQSFIYLPKPHIPSDAPPTRSLRSLVAAPCRLHATATGDACRLSARTPLRSRNQAALRSNRLQAG